MRHQRDRVTDALKRGIAAAPHVRRRQLPECRFVSRGDDHRKIANARRVVTSLAGELRVLFDGHRVNGSVERIHVHPV